MPEHEYTISSSCEPDGSGELKQEKYGKKDKKNTKTDYIAPMVKLN